MKKALMNSLITGIVIFIVLFIVDINSKFYSASMYVFLDEDYPGFLEVVEDYGTNSYEPVYEGYSKAEVVALDALHNFGFKVEDTEERLNQKIKEADPFNNGSNADKVTLLKDALVIVQQIKDKYYVKSNIVDGLNQSVPVATIVFGANFLVEIITRFLRKKKIITEPDYEAEKDNRLEEDEYPSRRAMEKPNRLN